ncbi:putative late blight resistance protein homolog R1A-3 [Salvia splendens]|uniref:putative late blight resistance protein homolog R1A-3 n=1 Tax=Salvia splendens TaxID=180675 RepID=UPI001C26A5F2|nr:putative late blight resistance protein homolog R1A-3 [Salvia splendens]
MNSLEIEDEMQLGDFPAANSSSLMAVASRIGDVVGLEDDTLAIKTRLCGESPKLQVIPIVGMREKSGQRDEETVYKSLKGRRYLIVMDDMWSTEPWDDVRDVFPVDHNGSRIILTTRLLDVATYVSRVSPLQEMRFMDIEQSWELLMQRVFGDEDCSPELESIGLKIARSCGGLPLAVSVIGGLLSMVERNPVSWLEIADNVG